MSLISDALYLEATAADTTRRLVDTTGALPRDDDDDVDLDVPTVPPEEQAGEIAKWIYSGRAGAPKDQRVGFPGLGWLRQPATFSDREWILEIAQQYRTLARGSSEIG